MALLDVLRKDGIKKVAEAVVAAETLLTEAKEATEAERKRKEKERRVDDGM